MSKREVFNFDSDKAAQAALKSAGFSLGENQRDSPRGVIWGDFLIGKWRNLSQADVDGLDAVYQRRHIGGPVIVTMNDNCDPRAIAALRKATQ